jgi:PAS domain S-box-containing protein
MRPSGIRIIGQVPWGTHFCQFYETDRDLIETLVPYFKAGLKANEFCMWVTSEPLRTAQAKAALKKAVPDLEARMKRGQIEILDYTQWYKKSGRFSSDEVLRGWVDKLEGALKKGFEGLRLTGNTFWLEDADWGDFEAYEEAVNDVIGRYRMIAVCTYSLKKCGATELLEVMANHAFALIKRRNRWQIIESARQKSTEQALKAEIAERTSAQARLSEAHQRLNTILETIADGFYALDGDWRFTLINDAALRHFGKVREDLLGRSLFEVFPGTRGSEFERGFRKALETGQPIRVEAPSVLMDKIMSIHAYPGPENLTVIFRDVTERRRAEEALRLSEQRQAAFAEATFEGIVLSEGGQILDCNDQFARMTGRSVEALKGTAIADLIVPEDKERVTENILQGRESVTEHSMVRPDGSRILVEAHGRPLSEAAPGRRLTAVRDITALKGRENELRHLNRVLAARSRSNQAMIRARDEAGYLQDVCRIVVEDCGHAMVWIGMTEDDEAKTVRPVASAGFEEGYLGTLKVTWADTERGRGPTGTAIRTGRPAGCEDMETDPRFRPWREEARRRGYASSLALPLVRDGEAFGAITIYARRPRAFSPEEATLMSGLADDLAYGVTALRLRQAHQRAEKALAERSLELKNLTETLEQKVLERTTELGLANDRLRAEIAERRRLVAAVQQDSDGVVIAAIDGTIDYVNPAFERLSGRAAAVLRGQACARVLTEGANDPKAAEEIAGAMSAGTSWSGRLTRRSPAGQTSELEVSLSPIRDETGRIVDYLAIQRDVTYELRLQQHLRQTQKTEALGTLAGGIAHDLNNILNPIFINTELVLLDAPLDEPMRRSLEMTLKAAERGRDLVKQIITFSRQKERERKPVKVGPIVEESLRFLRASLPRSVEIRTGIRPERETILADPVQIHQVVMNLCSNAAFAMRDSGGVLEVGLAEVEADETMARRHPDLKPGPYLRLTVADSGKGMTQQVLDRAFDPFFTTKAPGEGSGMGLAVVHGIVKDHGGAITVYSEVGQGSTFNVYLPRLGGPGDPSETRSEALVRGSERILLVDDEEAQAVSLKNMLEHLGYEVTVRTDGQGALGLFREDRERFDLVITDQAMPRMTGGKLAEEMLRLRPDLPIILCTGFSEQVDANGAKKLGLREFLMKPFSAREVSAAIRRAVTRK